MAFLNRLVGIGAGLAITGAAINATLYNGESHFKLSIVQLLLENRYHSSYLSNYSNL